MWAQLLYEAAYTSSSHAACWCVVSMCLVCRNLFDYDQVVNTQRDRVYAERRRALLNDDLSPLMIEYAEKTCDDILEVSDAVAASEHPCADHAVVSVQRCWAYVRLAGRNRITLMPPVRA